MTRNYYRDEPVLDARDDDEDPRPIIAHCSVCGYPIKGAFGFWDKEEAYYLNDEYVCEVCIMKYLRGHRV